MRIYKLSQRKGTKKAKIVFDFENGKAEFVWADGQFPKGAPCSAVLEELFKDMSGVTNVDVSTAGHSDIDTSKGPPDKKQVDHSLQEDFITQPEQERQM